MTRSFTVTELVTRVRQRAGIEKSQVLTDAEIISHIDAAYTRMYDAIVDRFENYFVISTDVTPSSGTATLPSDFYKLLGVDMLISTPPESIAPFTFSERNNTSSSVRYLLQNASMKFIPAPGPGVQFRVWYVPAPEKITTGSQVIDGIAGWEDFVVITAAIQALIKQELDASQLKMAQQEAMIRLTRMASRRDASGVAVVTDVYGVM